MEPGRKSKRVWQVVAACAVVLVVLVVGAVVGLRSSGLEAEIAKIRASGMPVRVEDLNGWYPAVAKESNAALGVLAAAELRDKDLSKNLQLPKRGEQVGARQLEEIARYVANSSNVVQTLRVGLRLRESRYPVALTSGAMLNTAPNPNLGEIKGLAQLLHYETVHMVAQGRAEAAFAPVRDGFALAGTLRNEPLLISELVRMACAAIALRSLESALPESEFDDAQLRELSSWLDGTEADCSRSWQRAIVGERTVGLQHFRTMEQSMANPTTGLQRLAGTFYRGLGFHDRDLRLYLELMRRFSDAMTNSFPKAYEESVSLSQELTNRFSTGLTQFAFLSKGVLPAIIKATGKEAALITSLRCARAAVAVERYRLAHGGELPEDLQALVPKYLAEVPRDGARGELVQFERIEGGYQLTCPAAAKILENKLSTVFPVMQLQEK